MLSPQPCLRRLMFLLPTSGPPNQWLQNMPLVTSDDSPSASNLYHLHVFNCFRIPIGLYARGVCRRAGWCTLSVVTSGFLNIFPSCIITLPLECTFSLTITLTNFVIHMFCEISKILNHSSHQIELGVCIVRFPKGNNFLSSPEIFPKSTRVELQYIFMTRLEPGIRKTYACPLTCIRNKNHRQ